LCTGIVQISARTPASCAMAALTLDHLSNGRFTLGLGVSGPQVVEGWYGQPFGKPLARTREYVEIVRRILAREEPVEFHGEHYSLPYDGPGSWGLGKPLRSITHPMRADLPILLGAEGPKNIALAADIADGWMPLYYSPFRQEVYTDSLKAAADKPNFEVCVNVMGCRISDDIEEALMPTKAALAFYIGGMGSRDRNFHKDAMARRGYGEAAERIQELFLAGRREEAIAAVPDQFIDDGGLIGSPARIRERFEPWTRCGITGLTIRTDQDEALELMADIVATRES
jgi:F420-dependent oxidoreductase-like protein